VYIRSWFCCNVTQRWLIITDVSEKPVSSIFNRKAPWSLKLGQIGCPETSVRKYQSAAGNSPEWQGFHESLTFVFCLQYSGLELDCRWKVRSVYRDVDKLQWEIWHRCAAQCITYTIQVGDNCFIVWSEILLEVIALEHVFCNSRWIFMLTAR
jgi:hypothetical protein